MPQTPLKLRAGGRRLLWESQQRGRDRKTPGPGVTGKGCCPLPRGNPRNRACLCHSPVGLAPASGKSRELSRHHQEGKTTRQDQGQRRVHLRRHHRPRKDSQEACIIRGGWCQHTAEKGSPVPKKLLRLKEGERKRRKKLAKEMNRNFADEEEQMAYIRNQRDSNKTTIPKKKNHNTMSHPPDWQQLKVRQCWQEGRAVGMRGGWEGWGVGRPELA